MGPVKDAQTSNDDGMTARPSGNEAVRCDPPVVPAEDEGQTGEPLQVEEPGYGYGV